MKIVKSLLIVVAVAAVAGGATYAYFSDTATMSGNTFSAGTMAIKIDQNVTGANQDWVDGFNTTEAGFKNQFTAEQYAAFLKNTGLSNLYPGATGQQIMDIKNAGTIDGVATIKFDATDWNALGDNLIFTVYYSNNSTSSTAGTFGNAIASGTLAQFNHNVYTLENIAAGAQGSVKIVWSVPTSAGNNIQGLHIGLNTTFGLNQVK